MKFLYGGTLLHVICFARVNTWPDMNASLSTICLKYILAKENFIPNPLPHPQTSIPWNT